MAPLKPRDHRSGGLDSLEIDVEVGFVGLSAAVTRDALYRFLDDLPGEDVACGGMAKRMKAQRSDGSPRALALANRGRLNVGPFHDSRELIRKAMRTGAAAPAERRKYESFPL